MFLPYQITNTGDAPHGSSCVPETGLGNEANVTGIKKEKKKSDITNKAWVPLLNTDRSNSKCGNIQSICCLASFVLVPVSYPAGGTLLTQTVQNRAHRAANQTSFWVPFACQCSHREETPWAVLFNKQETSLRKCGVLSHSTDLMPLLIHTQFVFTIIQLIMELSGIKVLKVRSHYSPQLRTLLHGADICKA